MRKFLYKYIDPLVPLWALPPLLACFAINCAVYWITMALCSSLYHYDLTVAFDEYVPFQTGWIFIYLVYCYVFWFISYCYIAHINRDNPKALFRFATADMLSRFICMLCFIFFPTTNTRPEVLGNDISDRMTRFLYSIDEPTNLFPSIHCLVSWFCFVGMRAVKTVPIYIKISSFISAVLICMSTQFLKQHYIADLVAAIALAEICYFLCRYYTFGTPVWRLYHRIVKDFCPAPPPKPEKKKNREDSKIEKD